MKRAAREPSSGAGYGDDASKIMDHLSLESALYDEDIAAPGLPDADAEPAFEPPQDIGVLPVKMAVPEKGLCYAFEKLLVLDETLLVETEYAKEKVTR